MTDYLLAFFGFFSSNENQWLFLFLSAFLSATVLPGNSEIVFSALATKSIYAHESFWHAELWLLVLVATVGNSLGSIVTYAMGMLAPKPINIQKRLVKCSLEKSEKYGVYVLLLSWLPFVGDILCAIAGWLRFPAVASVIFITIGKFCRYLILLVSLYPLLLYVVG